MGVIRRSFVNLDCKLLRSRYVTFIRPMLEFNVPVWLSALKCDIELLERVQLRATRLVPSPRSLNYGERLKALDLTTLSETRQIWITRRYDSNL